MAADTAIPQRVQFSGHETFPLRQLWLRKAFNAIAEAGGDPAVGKKVFTDAAAIRRFGVGKNMVSAIRHWALACDVLKEGTRGVLESGLIGEFLFGENGVDLYLERPASCWLVHWLLAGRAPRSTTWFWVFNRVAQQTFDRRSVVAGLEALVDQRSLRVSETTLKRDVEVCLRCYLPRQDGPEADDAAEPLLADLGLLSESPAGTFQFHRGQQQTLPNGVFAFALMEFWKRWEDLTGSKQTTLSFDVIAHDYGSPGRVFKLDENAVAERLIALEADTNGAIRWTDTAGVRQVTRDERALKDEFIFSFLRKAYAH